MIKSRIPLVINYERQKCLSFIYLKMRKIILLFTFFSFSCFYSQNYELKNPILLQYYKKINNAEEFILENKLDSALVNYKSAFSIFKNPHSVDIYNSLKVALKTKDNRQTSLLSRESFCQNKVKLVPLFLVFKFV